MKRGKKRQSRGQKEGEDKDEDQILDGGSDEAVISQLNTAPSNPNCNVKNIFFLKSNKMK